MALRKTRPAGDVDIDLTDADLTNRAVDGDSTAFEELYRRHADAAWRAAYAVVGNRDDAADAVSEAFAKVFQALPAGRIGGGGAPFRPYLLVATRNAAIDHLRRTGRLSPAEDLEQEVGPTVDLSPAERVVEGKDASYVVTAFKSLPERWRSVLWLTEVEGLQPREVAPMLGVSANGVAQLAVRARAGLRDKFLQAHLEGPVADDCRATIGLLGAYTGGGLSARDTAKVDQHLAGCAECRQRVAELEDVGSSLRRIIIPLPIGLAGLALAKWKAAASVARVVPRSPVSTAANIERMQRPLMAASVVTASLGIIGLGVVGDSDQGNDRDGRTRGELSAPPQAIVGGFGLPLEPFEQQNQVATEASAFGPSPTTPVGPVFAPTAPDSDDGQDDGGNGGDPDPDPPPPPPPAVPLAQVGGTVRPAGVSAALGVGGGCTGFEAGATSVGDCPAPPGTGALGVSTGGSLLGDRVVNLG